MIYARLAEEYIKKRVLYNIRNVRRYFYLPLNHTNSAIVDPAKAIPLFWP